MNQEVLEYVKMIAILLGIIVFAFFGVRFWLPKLSALRTPNAGPLKVACHLTLEPRKTLYVVQAGADYLMLAASEAGLQFVTTVDADGMAAALEESQRRRSRAALEGR
jgi:flagellar biogenesis protein FliO